MLIGSKGLVVETDVTVTAAGRPDKEPTKLESLICDCAEVASLMATFMCKVVALACKRLLPDCDPAKLQRVAVPPKALAIESQTWSLLS